MSMGHGDLKSIFHIENKSRAMSGCGVWMRTRMTVSKVTSDFGFDFLYRSNQDPCLLTQILFAHMVICWIFHWVLIHFYRASSQACEESSTESHFDKLKQPKVTIQTYQHGGIYKGAKANTEKGPTSMIRPFLKVNASTLNIPYFHLFIRLLESETQITQSKWKKKAPRISVERKIGKHPVLLDPESRHSPLVSPNLAIKSYFPFMST